MPQVGQCCCEEDGTSHSFARCCQHDLPQFMLLAMVASSYLL